MVMGWVSVGAYRIRPTNVASGDERSNRWPGTYGAYAIRPYNISRPFGGGIVDHGLMVMGWGMVGAYRIRPTNVASGDERSNRWPGTRWGVCDTPLRHIAPIGPPWVPSIRGA